jgi:hypothetical protein
MEYTRKDLVVGSKWKIRDSSNVIPSTLLGCILTITYLNKDKANPFLGIDFSVDYTEGRTGVKDWSVNEIFFIEKCIKISDKIEKLSNSINKIKVAL